MKIKVLCIFALFVLIISCVPVSEQPSICPYSADWSLVGRAAELSSEGKIVIASFNIQIFGKTKAEKQDVVDILADIGNDYDILAVQEFRDDTGEVIRYYLEQLNAESERYDVLFSERLGRSTSKEQYAFYYDANKFEVLGDYIFEDIEDVFEREPFLAHFKSREGNFDFVLVNIHTKPDDAESEINALASVVEEAKQHFNEQDILVLGDFNADGSYFNEESDYTALETGEYSWLICDDLDTTVAQSDNTYDRIVATQEIMEDFAEAAGVRYYNEEFGLTPEETKAVSDHFPVYAIFAVSKDTD
jgi:endonuclease/exonuclease/phosphatase family metal-dependent hydrolase